MGFSAVVAVLILFACIGQMRAAIMVPKFPEQKVITEKFKLHISERSAKYYEEIEIDEENDIAYFKVPPHNDLSQTDKMYDFKMNITVSRVNSYRVCHITPLPSDLPRPNVLSKGLKMLTNLPPSHKVETISQQWRLGDLVDKWTLRPEVREFCGQFPVYQLEPFSPDSVSVVAGDEDDTRAERTRRQMTKFPLCINRTPDCHPNKWQYTCQISSGGCVWYVTCDLNVNENNVACSTLTTHRYDSMVCCTPSCS